ncbi:MAG: hypothetical protein EOS34_31670 [Mesorhizobium sp.]|nr:MAG: hypothetical protein EOS34_31670 [Mesorhizobium sp.]
MDRAERRRRWSEADQCRILAAAFAPGATVAAVARQYDGTYPVKTADVRIWWP